MIWLVFAILTCTAVLSVVLPLAVHGENRTSTHQKHGEYDRAIAERGGLSRTIAALVTTMLIPALSLSFYLHLGHHGLADQPLANRVSALPGHKDAEKRVAELEGFLRKHPTDGRAYELIASFYLREHRPDSAIHALEEASRLLGPSAERLNALGEAKFFAAQGVVTQEVQDQFEASLKLDPQSATAKYYLGLAAAQSGDVEKATVIWSRLVAEAPAGANWIARLRVQLSELGKVKGPPRATETIR